MHSGWAMAHTVLVILVAVSSLALTRACNKHCTSRCKWTSWSAFGSCSAPCGGEGNVLSTRVRIQLGTCDMSECYREETRQATCSTPCLNGLAQGGKCKCNVGYVGECCEIGEDEEKPCRDRGGVCIEYYQMCDGGRIVNGMCGSRSNRACCVAGDPVDEEKPCRDRGGVCVEYYQMCDGGRIVDGMCRSRSNRACCVADRPVGPPVSPSVDPSVAPSVDPPVSPPVDRPVAPPVEPPVTPPANMQCKDKGGLCTPYWTKCSGGSFTYGLCGTKDVYECCIPGKTETHVVPNWEKLCKERKGACLFAWKTDCVGDILYGLCGHGGHECCISNMNIANDDGEAKCLVRGGHCLSRGEEGRCTGDCWSNFCGRGEDRRCCIPNSLAGDFQCVRHGGRCQSSGSCEGGQYRRGLCAGHDERKCCIAGLQRIAHTFPAGKCSDVTIVSRSNWGAEAADKLLTSMKLPVKKLIIHQTGYPACHSDVACQGQVRKIQMDDKNNKHLTDIGYNFLVGADGRAYVGRGWGYVGAHTDGHNEDAVSIAALGEYDSNEPSEKMIAALANLVDCAVQQGVLDADFEMFAPRQLACTVSAGKFLYDVIKTNSHHSSRPVKEGC